jgi:hypothetical protein
MNTRDSDVWDGTWRDGLGSYQAPATTNDGAWRDGYHELIPEA